MESQKGLNNNNNNKKWLGIGNEKIG